MSYKSCMKIVILFLILSIFSSNNQCYVLAGSSTSKPLGCFKPKTKETGDCKMKASSESITDKSQSKSHSPFHEHNKLIPSPNQMPKPELFASPLLVPDHEYFLESLKTKNEKKKSNHSEQIFQTVNDNLRSYKPPPITRNTSLGYTMPTQIWVSRFGPVRMMTNDLEATTSKGLKEDKRMYSHFTKSPEWKPPKDIEPHVRMQQTIKIQSKEANPSVRMQPKEPTMDDNKSYKDVHRFLSFSGVRS